MGSRETALQVLTACRVHGAWADAALKAQLRRDHLSGAESALCSRIVYGVMQNRLLLDYYLNFYCSQKLDHLQHPLPDILRIGAYQILFLDKVPDSAAVNESVNLAKASRRGQAAGLVNAVLRKIAQNKQQLPPLPDQDMEKRLSISYSHPKWLIKRLLRILGPEETEAFLQSNNTIAPLTVQVNLLKTDTMSLLEELQNCKVTVHPHRWVPDCLELSGTGDLTALPAFQSGKFMVQDGGARLVSLAADLHPGQSVLDVCAAPGGKSFSAAIAMEDKGEILACDLHQNKLSRIQEGARRLGLHSIQTQTADGRLFREEWESHFDRVFVDVPCSGIGIIRKKPDVRYKRMDDLFALPVIQAAILENAARYVRPGGLLIYSTCTVLPEENQQITDTFLLDHTNFVKKAFFLPPPVGEVAGELTLWPQVHDTDGFYICCMQRQS